MTACSVLLPALLLLGQAGKPGPPPLTDQQRTRLHELVRTTQQQAVLLKAQLDERQRALARLYADYELDERAVESLEAEIVDLQRRLLANYHRMQVELRSVVGRERFLTLKQRLDRVLAEPPKPPPGTGPTRQPPTKDGP
jgi:hypothetical protein